MHSRVLSVVSSSCFSSSSTIGPLYPHCWHMYCSGKSHMSKRVDKPIFGLPQHGHSLGVAFWCFRFPTTSRKFRSVPMWDCWLLLCAVASGVYWTSMLSFG